MKESCGLECCQYTFFSVLLKHSKLHLITRLMHRDVFLVFVRRVAYRKGPSFVIILFVTSCVFITFVVVSPIKGTVLFFLFLNFLTPELSSLSFFRSLALQIHITGPHILKANLELLYMVYKELEERSGGKGDYI